MAINTYLSIVPLYVNGLKAPIKRQMVAEWITKARSSHMLSTLQNRKAHKVKGRKRYFIQTKTKKAGVAILISDKIHFKTKAGEPWLVWLNGLSAGLRTKGSLVRFPVRTQAWVAGQVPSRRRARGNHTLMLLSLLLLLSL